MVLSLDYLNKIEGTESVREISDIFQKVYVNPEELKWEHGQLINFLEKNLLILLSGILYGNQQQSKVVISPKEQQNLLRKFLNENSVITFDQLQQETKPKAVQLLMEKTLLFSFTDFLYSNQLSPNQLNIGEDELKRLFKHFTEMISEFDTEWLEKIAYNNQIRLLIYSLITNNFEMFLEPRSNSNALYTTKNSLFFDKAEESLQKFLSANGFKCFLERNYYDRKNIYFIGHFKISNFQSNDFLKNKFSLVLKQKSGKERTFECEFFYRRDLKNYYPEANGFVGFKAKVPLDALKNGDYKFFIRIYNLDEKTGYYEDTITATTLFNRFKGYKKIANKSYLISVTSKNYIYLKTKGRQSKGKMLLRRGATHLFKILNDVKSNKAVAIDRLLYLLTYPIYHKRDIWLISERGDTCQDNSYHFFKYIREKYPRKKIYYIMDMSSKDYEKIKPYKNVISKDSLKHRIFILHSKIMINSYDVEAYNTPTFYSKTLFLKSFGDILKYKTVFLQHGISYNDPSSSISKNRIGNDLIITSLPKETEFILENMNYSKEEIKLTGFPRYDNLRYRDKVKKEILLMPTWRRNIVPKSYLTTAVHNHAELEKRFVESEYFQFYNNLLNSSKLSELIDKYDVTFKFYPHYEVQPFLNKFKVGNDKIQILGKDSGDVQDLLISADLLITDYSSVFFDFAVMKKPVVFCHFDYEDFYKTQYKKGVFDLKTMNLGYISNDIEETLKNIEKVIHNDFEMESQHKQSVDEIFYYELDGKYCERVYEAINSIPRN